MNIRLSAIEARIIGALIEKQITTPDQYPLSLNALINACNQKSNREPSMQLDEPTVKFVVEGLGRRHMVVEKSGFGSRVPKYQQIFCNTEFGSLRFTPQETAIVCELLLRGPQTPGELRSRVRRAWRNFPIPASSNPCSKVSRPAPAAPIVAQLAREPNRRDSRWTQLFEELPESARLATAGEVAANKASDAAVVRAPSNAELTARVATLESEIAALRAELATLKQGTHRVNLPAWAQSAGLLVVSNVFMTFAWYAHLKNMAARPWVIAALASWGIALFEYLVQVPANRIGYTTLSLGQLKVMQEVITLAVFVPFAILYMKQPLKLDFLWAGLCLVGAAVLRVPRATN